MDQDAVLLKKRIVEAAIILSRTDPDRFTVEDVVEAADTTKDEFYTLFDSFAHVLPAFYPLCIDQYRLVCEAIEGYDAFSLEERLSTFIFVLFDFLEEQFDFVTETFDDDVVHYGTGSPFRKELNALFRELLDTEDVPPVNRFFTDQKLLHTFLTHQYLFLVSYWLKDESPQREKTVALADKLVAFLVELVTFRGIERGVDLAKYLVNVGIIEIDKIPFVGTWFNDENAS